MLAASSAASAGLIVVPADSWACLQTTANQLLWNGKPLVFQPICLHSWNVKEALSWHVCQAPPRRVLPTWCGPRLVCALSGFQNGVWTAHVSASLTFSHCGTYTAPSSVSSSQEKNSLALIDGQKSHEHDGWRNNRILQNRAGRFFPHTWETENNVEGRVERLNSILRNSVCISL